MGDNDPREHVRRITAVFDQVAEGYDSPALRYFPFVADRLALKLRPAPGQKVLDICAGTGVVSHALAQQVGPSGLKILATPSPPAPSSLTRPCSSSV